MRRSRFLQREKFDFQALANALKDAIEGIEVITETQSVEIKIGNKIRFTILSTDVFSKNVKVIDNSYLWFEMTMNYDNIEDVIFSIHARMLIDAILASGKFSQKLGELKFKAGDTSDILSICLNRKDRTFTSIYGSNTLGPFKTAKCVLDAVIGK